MKKIIIIIIKILDVEKSSIDFTIKTKPIILLVLFVIVK